MSDERELVSRGVNPGWSPDGKTVAFRDQTYNLSSPSVSAVNADGTGLRKLARALLEAADDETPAWAPSGRRIAFTAASTWRGTAYIWLMNPDGNAKRRLVKGSFPMWSPLGREIVFSSNSGISVIRVAGGRPRTVARTMHRDGRVFWPSWSPRGRMLAYLEEVPVRGEGWERINLFTIRGDGTRRRRVAPDVYCCSGRNGASPPAWSRDGRRLFYACSSGSNPRGESCLDRS
jgi:Tol biopolymer transport system component